MAAPDESLHHKLSLVRQLSLSTHTHTHTHTHIYILTNTHTQINQQMNIFTHIHIIHSHNQTLRHKLTYSDTFSSFKDNTYNKTQIFSLT